MNEIILIDKPVGITSHDVIDRLRKITGVERIGHAGTLDPKASGLMIVAVGRENTKRISEYTKLDKEYEAEIILGQESTTYDSEGEITQHRTNLRPQANAIRQALHELKGVYEQLPPKYSAKKIKGRKAYELARAGSDFELKPVKITVYEIEVLDYKYPKLKIKTRVSSGTYIRSLAHDLGEKLGTGAFLKNLRRIKIGDFKVEDAQKIE